MRSQQYEDGRRNGVKGCVEWLHEYASTMNDTHARAVLNGAAWGLGVAFKDPPAECLDEAALTPATPSG